LLPDQPERQQISHFTDKVKETLHIFCSAHYSHDFGQPYNKHYHCYINKDSKEMANNHIIFKAAIQIEIHVLKLVLENELVLKNRTPYVT